MPTEKRMHQRDLRHKVVILFFLVSIEGNEKRNTGHNISPYFTGAMMPRQLIFGRTKSPKSSYGTEIDMEILNSSTFDVE